jgi:hypothetical protein
MMIFKVLQNQNEIVQFTLTKPKSEATDFRKKMNVFLYS